jgi:hypothetical protein
MLPDKALLYNRETPFIVEKSSTNLLFNDFGHALYQLVYQHRIFTFYHDSN